MKNYILFRLAWLPMAALMILTGCKKEHKETGAEGAPSVSVAEAYTDSVTLYKTIPGTLVAGNKTDVVARVNGTILSQHFTAGQYVSKGQALYTIESTTYRDAVAKAQAALSTAKAQYDYYAKQTVALKKALEADAVSKMQVVQAQSNMEQAAASMRDAEATISTAQDNLAHCTVRAPASGYITETLLDPGSYVNGQGAAVTLATIYNNSTLDAVFSLSDAQYEELHTALGGLSDAIFRNVPLVFSEPLKNTYTTSLFYEAPTVDQSTGTLVMRGKVTNVGNELKDGMYVTVRVPYGSSPDAILVKDAALSSDQLGSYLYTVNDSNKIVHTTVQTGDLYQDSLRIITSGIKPGTKYVTKALLTVRPGEKVNPVLTK